jgi:hypothetical protein
MALFEPSTSSPSVAVSTWFKVCLYDLENLGHQCTEIHNIVDMNISTIDVSEMSSTLAVALKHKACVAVFTTPTISSETR